MLTRWGRNLDRSAVLNDYPRPQMVRENWTSLNGTWSYAITSRRDPQPVSWDGDILVPFCVDSALSGVKKALSPEDRLWYRRTLSVPGAWEGQRVILHFGAVDWRTTVWVNGKEVGEHTGGYDPFSFDITDALEGSGDQQLLVAVDDPTNRGWQPRGKQVLDPEGIWYTAVSGIWQSVWLERGP